MRLKEWIEESNKGTVHSVRWCPDDGQVKGVIQIAHGVTEYILRYTEFAEYFTSKGFVVCGNDHRGHGSSLSTNGSPMYLGDKGAWFDCVNDIYYLYTTTKRDYPDTPYILMGFSMGSFMVRTALIQHPDMADAAIIMGTGHQDAISIALAKFMAKKEEKKHGYAATTPMIDQLTFGTYNKKFAPNKTKFDWLCANEEALQEYLHDPCRGDSMTVGLFAEMLSGMEFTAKQKNIACMRKDLPVLFISGSDDPVGENGKGVMKAVAAFNNAGMKNVQYQLYPKARHDVLREKCKMRVYESILQWLVEEVI